HLRAEGGGRRIGPGQPALARRRRRAPDRGRQRRGRPPLRGRLRVDPRHPVGRREHPRRALTRATVMRDGLIVVDKPPGFTSHDVVARLRRTYGQRRVGHAGTLDPDATGVLLVGLGRATRLLRYLSEAGKPYTGRVVLGIATSTLDAAGEVLDQRPMALTRDEVERALPRFVGDIEQLPPMVSAVKVGGRRLHELARA